MRVERCTTRPGGLTLTAYARTTRGHSLLVRERKVVLFFFLAWFPFYFGRMASCEKKELAVAKLTPD